MEVSESEKAIARHLQAVFGVRPQVVVHRTADDEPLSVAIAHVADYPVEGLVTLSTIGVSNAAMVGEDGGDCDPARVEFIASCVRGQEADMAEALFRAAIFVGKLKGVAGPGVFLYDLFGAFRDKTPMAHGFLTSPFAYGGLDDEATFAGRPVAWLQVIPTATGEMAYAQQASGDALEALFEARNVEWESLDRAPVI